jgi:SAM-dependent methyltransferase
MQRKAIKEGIRQAEKNGTLKHTGVRQPNFSKLVESKNYHSGPVPIGSIGPVHMLGVPTLLHFISNATQQLKPMKRVLDFGCGDGMMVAGIAFEFGLAQSDTFCLDIFNYVAKPAQTRVTFLLASHTTPSEYAVSLQLLLNTRQLKGTITAVTTMVTFHHIPDTKERTAALWFIRECLAETGFLLFSDWNNAGQPIDYTIYMDLTHFLPSLLYEDPAPTNYSMRRLNTEYLSINGWASVMKDAGLIYDVNASNLPWATSDNEVLLLPPVATYWWTSVLNFAAVFVKQAA